MGWLLTLAAVLAVGALWLLLVWGASRQEEQWELDMRAREQARNAMKRMTDG